MSGRAPDRTRLATWSGTALLTALVLLGVLARLNGLGVSLWMDEAWVANSLLERSWHDVFYYPHWLQTTPPGFLVMAASGVTALGPTPLGFRLVPLCAGLIGLGVVVALSRRLAPPFGLLAVTIAALSPTAIDYSRMLKQYSGELAVAALLVLTAWRYVEDRTWSRFAMLAVTLSLGLTVAYASVFTIGGVLVVTSPVFAWLIGRSSSRVEIARWAMLIALTGAVLAVEFLWFYQPNASPELRRFWQVVSVNRRDADPLQTVFRHFVILIRHVPVPTSLQTVAILTGFPLIGTAAVLGLRRRETRETTAIVLGLTGLPGLAILASGLLDLYPNFERTSLFLLPGVAILIGYSAQLVYTAARELGQARPALRPIALGVLTVTIAAGLVMLADGGVRGLAPVSPREEYEASVRLIGERVADGDLVFVHACCEEGFRLYRTLEPWHARPAVAVGRTGQPCCPRDKPVVKETPEVIAADVRQHLAPGFQGRVWLFYVDRADYWRYSSVAPEGPILRAALEAAGCRWQRGHPFAAMRVDVLQCGRS